MSEGRTMEWWKTSIIYQIYPRSFCDSNGDGIGDLRGIISKLDYLQSLNVGAVWLSPFYRSPMKDFGYDVSDYRDVDPIFGTLQHFDELIAEAHGRGLKIIVDFVPNHTSDQHEWFQKSCLRQAPYDDYYIWRDARLDKDGNRQPPNNWLSVFGGTAWRWHEGRGQYYYTAFTPQQPDLNYRNHHVVRQMNDVVRFWMQKGVDGLRVDALENLFEDEDLTDDPVSGLPDVPEFQYAYLDHQHTEGLPEIGDMLKGWRGVMEEFEHKDGHSRFMVIETYEAPSIRNRFYEYGGNPFNHDLVMLKAPLSGNKLKTLIQREYQALPNNGWPTFVLGNHDRQRVCSKFGQLYCEVLNMLLLTLKGTPCTYYGEELGMEEIQVSFQETMDPWGKNFGPDRYQEFSRDPWRSPMQWDSTTHAGFTSGSSPWLPIHPNYLTCNVKNQQNSTHQSPVKLYAAVARLREEAAFQEGELLFSCTDNNVLSYVRQLPGDGSTSDRYLVVLNVGAESCTKDYSASPVNSQKGVVVQGTSGVIDRLKNREVALTELGLDAGQGLIIKLL